MRPTRYLYKTHRGGGYGGRWDDTGWQQWSVDHLAMAQVITKELELPIGAYLVLRQIAPVKPTVDSDHHFQVWMVGTEVKALFTPHFLDQVPQDRLEVVRTLVHNLREKHQEWGARIEHAAYIYAIRQITPLGDGRYSVQSERHNETFYLVDAKATFCSCVDQHRNGNHCKHLIAVDLYEAAEGVQDDPREVYEWPAYAEAQPTPF